MLGTLRDTTASRQRAQRELTPERRSDPVLDEVARSLRAARARTGMSETQVVAVLAEQGFKITVTRLRGWERTGVIRVDAAAQLAERLRHHDRQPRGPPRLPLHPGQGQSSAERD